MDSERDPSTPPAGSARDDRGCGASLQEAVIPSLSRDLFPIPFKDDLQTVSKSIELSQGELPEVVGGSRVAVPTEEVDVTAGEDGVMARSG
jgi:hypothetical protein